MENTFIEYKRELTDGLEKEAVAFLNMRGGQIQIGVDDKGEIVGVDNADDVCLRVADRLKNNICPSIMGLFQITIAGTDKKYVVITLASGIEKPYFIKKYGMSSKGCYIRIGTQSAPMEQAQIETLFSRRVCRTLSTMVSPRQDLTFTQLRIYYQENGYDTTGDYFYRNLGMLTADNSFNYFAMLLSDQSDVTIKVAHFKGIDKVEILTNKEFGYCCILKSVYNILDYLENYNLPSVKITYPKRVEKYLIDRTALREAVVNAIVHNDYVHGGSPLIEIYEDRIRIVSYGGLVNGLSKEEFFSGFSMPRNRELMRVFRDMELVENFGSGLHRILRVYNRNIFKISENFVITEFKFDTEVLKQIRVNDSHANKKNVGVNVGVNEPVNVGVNVGVNLSESEKEVLEILSKGNKQSAVVISQRIHKTSRTVERILKELVNKGYIRRVGSDKTGHYEILKKK